MDQSEIFARFAEGGGFINRKEIFVVAPNYFSVHTTPPEYITLIAFTSRPLLLLVACSSRRDF